MRWDGDRIRFSPSDLSVYLASDFAAWMDRWWLERGRKGALPLPVTRPLAAGAASDLPLFAAAPRATALECSPQTPDDDARVLMQRGAAHEQAVLDQLAAAGIVTAITLGEGALDATRRAIEAGVAGIYQAHLASDRFEGRADFLLRVEAAAGRFLYEPADAKLARRIKPDHVVQLCAYAAMLTPMQGIAPRGATLFLGDGSRQRIDLDHQAHYVRRLMQAFLDAQDAFDPLQMPHPGHGGDHGRWTQCADTIVALTDHVRGVAGIRTTQIRKLERAGITTMTQLAAGTATPGEVAAWNAPAVKPVRVAPGIAPDVLAHLSTQARLQIESRGLRRPHYEVRPHADPLARRGLTLVAPESALDVYFDMEGHPLPDGNWEYLFGSVYEQAGEVEFHDLWALRPEDERPAFEAFVDWAYARWQQDPGAHIYHYNVYEVAALRRLMGKYGSREEEVDQLLRHEVFVDLYRVVQQGLVIGTPGYSLKDLEPLFRSARGGIVKTAQGCMAAFEGWLDTPDGLTWRESPTLQAIRDYNRDDCESTLELARWLRGVQSEAGLQFVPAPRVAERLARAAVAATPTAPNAGLPAGLDSKAVLEAFGLTPPEDDPDGTELRVPVSASEQLAQTLLGISAQSTDPERARVATVLAHLVGYHRREWKPAWWRIFDRAGSTSEELETDFDCLAGLERLHPIVRGAPVLWDYSFDADQDTKLEPGDLCCFAADIDAEVRIVTMDPEAGRITLDPERGASLPPAHVDLVRKDIPPIRPLANAVFRFAAAWAEGQVLSPAVDDLLFRRPARIAGHTGGSIAPEGVGFVPALTAAVRNLQQSTLCIQGPPGTGKTHKASEVILELLREGRIVGVMAHSHKAIVNLMQAVLQRATELGITLGGEAHARVVKIGGEPIADGRVAYVKTNSQIETELARGRDAGRGLLVGGTAWCFARAAEQTVDVLFVDEAGQVALANLVAAGSAARNLVLVGDQMQLAQPIQGAHPGESGQSALQYLLQEQATIPDDFGVFLATTHRMHPDVCGFISEAVYDGRLHADAKTEARRVVFGRRIGPRVLQRPTGVVWVPVPHEGNSQASEPEVDAVAGIVHELLTAQFRSAAGVERPMQLNDVLVVAPYNMQVRRLYRRLRADFAAEPRVGSVDRFQGLEAPAVVVSMCASSIEDVPRGLEFLLSPNRINVAISRAQCLAVVVGSPTLLAARCRSLEQMRLLDLYCRLVEYAERQAGRG